MKAQIDAIVHEIREILRITYLFCEIRVDVSLGAELGHDIVVADLVETPLFYVALCIH